MVASDDVQVAVAVASVVVASDQTAVAVNPCGSPFDTEGAEGATVTDWRVAALTVSVASPVVPPRDAVMVLVPSRTPVATAPVIVATPALADVHVASAVTSCVDPSLYLPVAVNASANPFATVGVAGATEIVSSTGAVTSTVAVPLWPSRLAETVVDPRAAADTSPAFTVAIPGLADVHTESAVRSCWAPFE
jgi:hypothetical protein